MKNLMKCIIVMAAVVAGMSNVVFAGSNDLVSRDTVIPDTVKQEILLALNTCLLADEVVWTKIEASDVPETVVKAVNEKYKGYAIEESYKGDNDQYKLVIKKDERALIVIFDKDGKFVREMEE